MACWDTIPEDGQWYTLLQPVVLINEEAQRVSIDNDNPWAEVGGTSAGGFTMRYGGGTSNWSHLSEGPRHWKVVMMKPADAFAKMLRFFGAETHCRLCAASQGCWDTHCTSSTHFHSIYEAVEEGHGMVREALWQQIHVVGGCVRYNHLDGEVQALRRRREPVVNVERAEDLPIADQWFLVSGPVCVATETGGDKDAWPNLWSRRHWKDQMGETARHLGRLLELEAASSGGLCNFDCHICGPGMGISADHLLGPRHYGDLVTKRVHHNVPVHPEEFWQTFAFPNSAVAFNHLDGQVKVVRRPRPSEVPCAAPAQPPRPAAPAGPPPAGGRDPHARMPGPGHPEPQPPAAVLVDTHPPYMKQPTAPVAAPVRPPPPPGPPPGAGGGYPYGPKPGLGYPEPQPLATVVLDSWPDYVAQSAARPKLPAPAPPPGLLPAAHGQACPKPPAPPVPSATPAPHGQAEPKPPAPAPPRVAPKLPEPSAPLVKACPKRPPPRVPVGPAAEPHGQAIQAEPKPPAPELPQGAPLEALATPAKAEPKPPAPALPQGAPPEALASPVKVSDRRACDVFTT